MTARRCAGGSKGSGVVGASSRSSCHTCSRPHRLAVGDRRRLAGRSEALGHVDGESSGPEFRERFANRWSRDGTWHQPGAVASETHLLVMAKEPVAGAVKTRLCPAYSPGEAAEIAAAALHDTLAAVASCGARRRILALQGRPGPWLPPGFEIIDQVDGGLDIRLAAAWDAVGGPGVQIGMDTPQLTGADLDDALATLLDGGDRPDAVLGPALDGGWWAIGLHEPDPALFVGVPMSAPQTCRAQRERLARAGRRVVELRTVRDLDTVADAVALVADAPHTRTARVLAGLGPTRRTAGT